MQPIFRATRRVVAGAFTAAALLAAVPSAFAQAWPNKPLRIVIGAPAGGTTDIIARLLADGLHKELGQPVIVDAKPGAAGLIAMQDFLGQPADGHTLLVAINALVTEIPHVIKLRFDPFNSVRPVADLARSGLVFVGNPALPEVPTFAEQGFPMLEEVAWIGLWVKPDVSADVQARLRQAALKVMAQPAVQARLAEFGNDAGSGATPEELSKSLRRDYDKQGATLRGLGIHPQDLGG